MKRHEIIEYLHASRSGTISKVDELKPYPQYRGKIICEVLNVMCHSFQYLYFIYFLNLTNWHFNKNGRQ